MQVWLCIYLYYVAQLCDGYAPYHNPWVVGVYIIGLTSGCCHSGEDSILTFSILRNVYSDFTYSGSSCVRNPMLETLC